MADRFGYEAMVWLTVLGLCALSTGSFMVLSRIIHGHWPAWS
jgi:hypothetical protein